MQGAFPFHQIDEGSHDFLEMAFLKGPLRLFIVLLYKQVEMIRGEVIPKKTLLEAFIQRYEPYRLARRIPAKLLG